jgi:hypothetical protein
MKVIVCVGTQPPQICEIERLTPTNRIRWADGQGPIGKVWHSDKPKPVYTNQTYFQVSDTIFPYSDDNLLKLIERQATWALAEQAMRDARLAYETTRADANSRAGVGKLELKAIQEATNRGT